MMLRSLRLSDLEAQTAEQENTNNSQSFLNAAINGGVAFEEASEGQQEGAFRTIIHPSVAAKLDLASIKLAGQRDAVAGSNLSTFPASVQGQADDSAAGLGSQLNASYEAKGSSSYSFTIETAEPSVNYSASGSDSSSSGLTSGEPLSGASTTVTFRIDNVNARAIDADKIDVNDTQLCWAATASNMLYWAGWTKNLTGLTVNIEDDLLAYYASCFTDQGGFEDQGISWFTTGSYTVSANAAQIKKSGGSFYPSVNLSKYMFTDERGATAVSSLVSYLNKGYVCGLGVYWLDGGGHAITCWGYTYDSSVSSNSKSYITGVWVSDSDDNKGQGANQGRNAPDTVKFCPITWSSANGCYIISVGYNGVYYQATLSTVVGLASAPTASSGFTQIVSSSVSGETVVSGTQSVISGGYTASGTIGAYGIQSISEGGIASKTTLTNGGIQNVSSGGSAVQTYIGASSIQNVSSGGYAARTTISAGGTQSIQSGASALVTQVAGSQVILGGGIATSTTVSAGGLQTISSGAYASITTVSSGGTQSLLAGASASQTVINGGTQMLSSGAVATSTTMNAGIQLLLTGAVANQNTITGGMQTVQSGAATTDTSIGSSGYVQVVSGGTVSGTLLIDGGRLTAASASSLSDLTNVTINLKKSNSATAALTTGTGAFSSAATNWTINVDGLENGTYVIASGSNLASLNSSAISYTVSWTETSTVDGEEVKTAKTAALTLGTALLLSNGSNVTLTYTDGAGSDQLSLAYSDKAIVSITSSLRPRGSSEEITVSESSGSNSVYTISRQGGDTSKALVIYFKNDGTTTYGSDYTLSVDGLEIANSVVIAAGQTSVDVTLSIINDIYTEADETVKLTLTQNKSETYELDSNSSSSITIKDDDTDAGGSNISDAVKIKLGEPVSDQVTAVDSSDCFKFEATSNGEFTFSMSGAGGNAKLLVYQLVGSKMTLVSSKAFSGSDVSISKALASGTYYAMVQSVKSTNTTYTLALSGEYFPDPTTTDNSYKSATDLGALAAGDGQSETSGSTAVSLDVKEAWVGFKDAADFYQFSLDEAGKFTISALNGSDSDAKITLYKVSGGKLTAVATATLKDGAADISDKILQSGTYYVKVSSSDNGAGKANSYVDLKISGSYFASASDDNSASATKNQLALSGDNQEGWVGVGDALDYFTFTLSSKDSVTLDLTAEDANAKLTLYKKSGSSLVAVGSYTALEDAELSKQFKNLSAGEYFVSVKSLNSNSENYNTKYQLSATSAAS